jgi:hypothetical protein
MDIHGRNKCPFCREQIVSRAPNVPLQQLIQSFVAKRDKVRHSLAKNPLAADNNNANNNNNSSAGSGGVGKGAEFTQQQQQRTGGEDAGFSGRGGGGGGEGEGSTAMGSADADTLIYQYERELAVKSTRCRVLRNELMDSEEELRQKVRKEGRSKERYISRNTLETPLLSPLLVRTLRVFVHFFPLHSLTPVHHDGHFAVYRRTRFTPPLTSSATCTRSALTWRRASAACRRSSTSSTSRSTSRRQR